jgi:hypothetical protein
MKKEVIAERVIESLRKGIPPQRGVELYSVGNEKLIEGLKRFHLNNIEDRGIIRFVNGSWGSGKTHLFRQLRDLAFNEKCLVSNVELDTNSAALNKFQSVFSSIIRQISAPSNYENDSVQEISPFGSVIKGALAWLACGEKEWPDEITQEHFNCACEKLMSDPGIDIDFKKLIRSYWETYLDDSADPMTIDQTRGEILQWFSSEGTISAYRKKFGITKMITKDNAKLMLQSLANFVKLSGYRGLIILFDETEQAYSVMRKSALRDAHNNLLSLINNIETLAGLFLIYATTPDFFNDPKHGIVIYGALAGRIGKPEDRQPRALDTIWNLDAIETNLGNYQEVANKIKNVYVTAYPEVESQLPTSEQLIQKVSELYSMHPSLASVRFWRLLVTALVLDFDDYLEGRPRSVEKLYDDVMDRLREV